MYLCMYRKPMKRSLFFGIYLGWMLALDSFRLISIHSILPLISIRSLDYMSKCLPEVWFILAHCPYSVSLSVQYILYTTRCKALFDDIELYLFLYTVYDIISVILNNENGSNSFHSHSTCSLCGTHLLQASFPGTRSKPGK